MSPADRVQVDERLARALLSRVAEPGDRPLVEAVARWGAAEVVARLRDGSLDVRGAVHLGARVGTACPDRDLETMTRIGGRFVIPGDAEWPAGVDDLARLEGSDAAAPLGLWVRGEADLGAVCGRAVAVVGARASTAYGEYVASELGLGLAERSWTVVSGGAYGIDGAAHRGALGSDGCTVAVLACGVDVPYPRGHSALLARIAEQGLVVSEWPPGCAPMRHRFLTRNRVIAALAAGTVVVEAAVRSGALSTANRARDLGRYVMAVPGPVTSAMSAGTNGLLKQPDVACVTGVADVVELIGAIGTDLAPDAVHPVEPRDDLDPITRRVLEAVPVRRAAGAASIARTAGIDFRQATRALGALAALGFVERLDAGWRVARRRE